MSKIQIERLVRENEKQRFRINELENEKHCLKNDSETYQELLKRLKHELQKQKQQMKTINKKLQINQFQKEQTESRYLLVLRKLQEEIQERKRKYDQLSNKIAPLIDQDSVRLRILNEVEFSHNLEIDQYKRTIENLKDQLLHIKRQNQLNKHRYQTIKIQFEDQQRKVRQQKNKEKNQQHLDLLSYQMCNEVQNKLRLNLQHARKQTEYYKQKYFNNQKKYQEKVQKLQNQILRNSSNR